MPTKKINLYLIYKLSSTELDTKYSCTSIAAIPINNYSNLIEAAISTYLNLKLKVLRSNQKSEPTLLVHYYNLYR